MNWKEIMMILHKNIVIIKICLKKFDDFIPNGDSVESFGDESLVLRGFSHNYSL